jgi:hypothetical protein
VLQRNEVWMSNKQKKLDSAREQSKDKGTEECTFEPKLCAYKPPKPASKVSIEEGSRHSLNRSNSHSGSNAKPPKNLKTFGSSNSSYS